MKKIVALVLCLALALSLCTVSFAASDLVVKDWTLYDLETNKKVDDITEINKDEGRVDEEDGVEPTVYEVVTEAEGEDEVETFFYACVKAVATHKLVKGSTVVWLMELDAEPDVDYVENVVDKFIEAVEDAKCGEYDKEDYEDGVYVIENKAYAVATSGNMVMYKGLVSFVTDLEDEAEDVDHDFTSDDAKLTSNSDFEPVSIKCGTCEKTYKVVEEIPDTYVGTVDTDVLEGYAILLDKAATVAADGTTVESAKTFDAGIALYAGMALASVAGSAVVIDKKKEF